MLASEYAIINSAVDSLTNAEADVIQRAASSLQTLINTGQANAVSADPIVKKLKDAEARLRATDFNKMIADDEALAQTVNPAPNENTGNSTQSAQPATEETDTTSVSAINSNPSIPSPTGETAPPSQVGVSDSDNPLAPNSPAPLGSPQPIPVNNQPPSDPVLQTLNPENANPSNPAVAPDPVSTSPSENEEQPNLA